VLIISESDRVISGQKAQCLASCGTTMPVWMVECMISLNGLLARLTTFVIYVLTLTLCSIV